MFKNRFHKKQKETRIITSWDSLMINKYRIPEDIFNDVVNRIQDFVAFSDDWGDAYIQRLYRYTEKHMREEQVDGQKDL